MSLGIDLEPIREADQRDWPWVDDEAQTSSGALAIRHRRELLDKVDRLQRFRDIQGGVLDRLARIIAEAADRLGIPEGGDEESSTSLLEQIVARAESRA